MSGTAALAALKEPFSTMILSVGIKSEAKSAFTRNYYQIYKS